MLGHGIVLRKKLNTTCKQHLHSSCVRRGVALKATIEFRQFPGGDFNQTLVIWGRAARM